MFLGQRPPRGSMSWPNACSFSTTWLQRGTRVCWKWLNMQSAAPGEASATKRGRWRRLCGLFGKSWMFGGWCRSICTRALNSRATEGSLESKLSTVFHVFLEAIGPSRKEVSTFFVPPNLIPKKPLAFIGASAWDVSWATSMHRTPIFGWRAPSFLSAAGRCLGNQCSSHSPRNWSYQNLFQLKMTWSRLNARDLPRRLQQLRRGWVDGSASWNRSWPSLVTASRTSAWFFATSRPMLRMLAVQFLGLQWICWATFSVWT